MGAPHRTAPHAAGAFCGRERPGGFFIRVPASATHIYYIQYARRQWVIVGMRAAAHDLQRRWESGGSVRALPAFAARRRPPTRPFPSLPREGKLREGSDCDGIHQPGSLGCARATTGVVVSAYADRAGHRATNGGTRKKKGKDRRRCRAPSSICFFFFLFTGRTMHALRFAVAAGRRMANRWRASCSLTRAAVDLTGRTDGPYV
jgi:hypothetical protein